MKPSNTAITNDTIDTAAKLEWTARNLARGLQSGKHHSKRLGVGMEFNQFRNYVQGDDIRLLDWKMYAKTNQYFIRESEIETNHNLHLTIDNSPSMDYSEDGLSKIELAKSIVAALSYVMARQADYFSWSAGKTAFAKCSGMKNWRRSILELFNLETESNSVFLSGSGDDYGPMGQKNGMHLLITDMYMEVQDFENYVSAYTNADNEMIVFHLVGQNEESLNFGSNTKFIDLESGDEMHVDAKKYGEKYKEAFGEHIYKMKRICQNKGIVYRKIQLQSDQKNELQAFLSDYNSLKQR